MLVIRYSEPPLKVASSRLKDPKCARAALLRRVTVLWLAQGHVNADGSSAEDVKEWAARTQAEAAVEGAQAAVERGDKVLLLPVALTPK